MNNHQATPTQYNGILYKSKSEAILARVFDLMQERSEGEIVIKYEYEPEVLRLSDGYVPDFYVSYFFTSVKSFFNHIVEYKPSGVTSAYKDKLAKRFDNYAAPISDQKKAKASLPKGFDNATVCALYIGSAYDDNERTVELYLPDKEGWLKPNLWEQMGIASYLVEEARSYRFDLKP